MLKRNKQSRREQRRRRVRARVIGTAERPRLNVFRSLTTMYVQLINDDAGKTLLAVNAKNTEKGDAGERKGKTAMAYLMGKTLGDKAKATGITKVVFDRAGYAYHGRVAAVAEGARDGGLEF
jgi:large subunit ribosomal protein L18